MGAFLALLRDTGPQHGCQTTKPAVLGHTEMDRGEAMAQSVPEAAA